MAAVEQGQLVIPGQLCKHRLHKFAIRPRLGERAHVLEVARRKALHVREGVAQILCQPLNHLGTPVLAALASEDIAANLPIKQHQFAIDRQRRALLGGVNACFEFGQPGGVVRR